MMADARSTTTRIVTLTMNPALDITTRTEQVRHTDKIRCGAARHDPGGGGINVARVAAALGASVSAVFPTGGLTGARVVELLRREKVDQRHVAIADMTRESLTIDESSTGKQYRFVLPGPTLTASEQTACLEALERAAAGAEFVVASGSLPPGVSPDFYQRVSDLCHHHGALFVLDASGGGLTHLRSGVHLLKPSLRELRECTGQALETDDEQLAAAHELIDRGCAANVLISRGGDDALLASALGSQRFPALRCDPGSGVGAGDALVAGVTVGLSRAWPLPDSVRLGMAAGAAMLLTPGTAACRLDDVWRLFDRTSAPVELAVGR